MKKILAADAAPGLLEFYKALFSEAGFEVETAPDGAIALDKYLHFKPDLLVLDVELPEIAGERFFWLVRKRLQAGLPAVFVTALPEKVRKSVLAEEKVSVLRKPVKGGELLAEVNRLLKLR